MSMNGVLLTSVYVDLFVQPVSCRKEAGLVYKRYILDDLAG